MGILTVDTPVFVAVISAAANLTVAAITFFLTKRKEREAEWRKEKLEHYREFQGAIARSNLILRGKGMTERLTTSCWLSAPTSTSRLRMIQMPSLFGCGALAQMTKVPNSNVSRRTLGSALHLEFNEEY
ncbi:MAG: hypothetical protein ACOZAQ_07160 [Pseudomonadota bacterium]